AAALKPLFWCPSMNGGACNSRRAPRSSNSCLPIAHEQTNWPPNAAGLVDEQVIWSECVYLLDTNVVSELRKPRPHGAVLAWINGVDDASLYLSAVTLAENRAGIEITRDRDAAKAAEIDAWLDLLTDHYQIIALDGPILRQWA